MKTKTVTHTPGPWKLCNIGGEDAFGIKIRGGYVFARVFYGGNIRPEIGAANADLIAAAPDLKRFAEAIEESVNDALRPGSPDNFMSLVNRLQDYRAWACAAIAKAEGK